MAANATKSIMNIGKIGWVDLTVDDAATARDFYRAVVGWESEEVDMGGYSDFTMMPPGHTDGVAGVCHARGSNADLPPTWSRSGSHYGLRGRTQRQPEPEHAAFADFTLNTDFATKCMNQPSGNC